jgi:hypothetical protein
LNSASVSFSDLDDTACQRLQLGPIAAEELVFERGAPAIDHQNPHRFAW